jgi:hypothetical protein
MKSKPIIRPLRKIEVLRPLLGVAFSLVVAACSSAPIEANVESDPVGPGGSGTQDSSAELSAPAEFFKAVEAIALEFEARKAHGRLSDDWLHAWSATERARQPADVTSLIAAVRRSESASLLLARDGATIERYTRAMLPVVAELEKHALAGTLDSILVNLYAPLKAIVTQFDTPDAQNTRADTFCCKIIDEGIYELTGQALDCHEFHTAGVLARFKCAHASLGYPINNVYSSLVRRSCSSDPECPGSSPRTGIVVTAQSTYSDYSPQRAADGDVNTQVGPRFSWVNGHTSTPNGVLPQWLQFDLGSERVVSGVRLFTSLGYEIQDYDIETWSGIDWVHQVRVNGNVNVQRDSTFSTPVATQLIRVLGYRGPSVQPQYVRVNELEIF